MTLVIISPLKGYVGPSGRIILTQKFVDGVSLYRKLWGGPILHLCEPASDLSNNLDNIEVAIDNAAFRTSCAELSEEYLRAILPKRSLVLSAVGERFNSVSRICRAMNIPCVYVTEYTLLTRMQIVAEYQRNSLQGAWSKLLQIRQEIAQRGAISIANAVQCNGLPTYSSYKSINSNPHLFFDNRIEEKMLASDEQIFRRSLQLQQSKKVRLTFSGRLNLMKGVDDLILVADHLRRLQVPFAMAICGDGDYLDELKKGINEKQLNESVKLRGVLEFKTELVPFVTEQTDIFICCHRQGDPSCTYIETMGCGVPVIGYANEAWRELAHFSKSGWISPTGNPRKLAEKIAELSQNPAAILQAGSKSRDFARDHTFEKTFDRRIRHLDGVACASLR